MFDILAGEVLPDREPDTEFWNEAPPLDRTLIDPELFDEMAWDDNSVPVDPGEPEGPSGFAAFELDLASKDPRAMSDAGVLDGIVELDKVISWAQARQARLLSEFLDRRGDAPEAINANRPSSSSSFAPDEVGVALRISRGSAMYRLNHARFLARKVPALLDAWESGLVDGAKVRVITDAVAFLPDDLAVAVVARVLPRAPEQSLAQLRAALAKAIIAVDPEGANTRHRKARHERRITVDPEPEAMATVRGLVSAPDARSVWEWLTRLARGLGKDDPRPMDTRRADLFVALLTGRLTAYDTTDPGADTEDRAADADADDTPEGADRLEGTEGTDPTDDAAPAPDTAADCTEDANSTEGVASISGDQAETPAAEAADPPEPVTRPTPEGPHRPARERIAPVTPGKPLIHITIPYTTLTGADEQPCELAGYGAIPADLAREIAADAVWKRLVTDPLSEALLDRGRTTYHPPAALADFVRARHLHCRGPRCRRPASSSELDHYVPYPDGPTSEPNLWAACKHDHDLKHHGSWKVLKHPDGSLEWITPTGYRHVSHPHDYRPDLEDLRSGLPEPEPPQPPPTPIEPDDDPAPF